MEGKHKIEPTTWEKDHTAANRYLALWRENEDDKVARRSDTFDRVTWYRKNASAMKLVSINYFYEVTVYFRDGTTEKQREPLEVVAFIREDLDGVLVCSTADLYALIPPPK